ncbi:sialidase family protein [Rhodocytophaga aerolata]|uniref:Sialidase family protein n=1 Tax=Rhodocytophaga aerolata TaxID=455078 RepID=A0ABT8RAZ9_9BACT|nr:sialidase family protein [Rhodocytophaga aerolata]MDO1449179.1 sialidase family protein [Rhodocytophaga aerolata]
MRYSKVLLNVSLMITFWLFVDDNLFAQQFDWVIQAPGPITGGQVENIKDGEVVGAIKSIAVHPTNANIVYVGAVNGGIWKTNNAMATNPVWINQTDDQKSLSISVIKFDPIDVAGQTLIAGNGRFSSFYGYGGLRSGLLRTTNGGLNWSLIDGGGILTDINISGAAARGPIIIVSSNNANDRNKIGVWRSTDMGRSWHQMSGDTNTGLPKGISFDLASDPSNNDILFTNISGVIYRSLDIGETWTKVSNPTMDGIMAGAGNIKITVGTNNVYVAAVRSGRLAGVFRSPDGGNNWVTMSIPNNNEGGIHPGSQGNIHLSLVADPSNHNVVYIGGDRQRVYFNGDQPIPNFIGAKDYSGILFRGDASKPLGQQWVHLTHSKDKGPTGGGTLNSTAPHADSRDMAVTINGVLIEVNDGGIYKRTNPQNNNGDWFSMNGNIKISEFHSIAWDANSDIIIGGAQDTGTPVQKLRSNQQWKSVSTGDGGVVAVDDISIPNSSIRYSSYYNLSNFKRDVYNRANVLQSRDFPGLQVLNGGSNLIAQFYTPIKLNSKIPKRLIIGAQNSVYESIDQGTTIMEIGYGIKVNDEGANPIAYGATDNEDILYVGSYNRVYVRKEKYPDVLSQSNSYNGGRVMGIANNPNKADNAFVISTNRVYQTTDAGVMWSDITGNLATYIPGNLRSVAYSNYSNEGALIIGSDIGIFIAMGPDFSLWNKLGKTFPRVPVLSLEYDHADRILVAGTLGRGAFSINFPTSDQAPPPAVLANIPTTPTTPSDLMQSLASQNLSNQFQNDSNSVTLSPGVVINIDKKTTYIMSPNGGIDAINLETGKKIWNNKSTDKPIGFALNYLISQTASIFAENTLQIAALNATTGTQTFSKKLTLPEGVKASVVDTFSHSFAAIAESVDGNIQVNWQFAQFEDPMSQKGLPPGTEERIHGQEDNSMAAPSTIDTIVTKSGLFQINLSTGNVSTNIVVNDSIETNISPVKALTNLENTGDISVNQFLSANEQHILVSQQVDNQSWEKYNLIIFERKTNTRIGEFKSHFSFIPFIVIGSHIFYVTQPYTRRTPKGIIEEPLKIRAYDLKTNKVLWSRQIRDTTSQKILPP